MELDAMLQKIDGAGERELNELVQRIIRRYAVLFPEDEVIFCSLPLRDHEERSRILDGLYALMTKR